MTDKAKERAVIGALRSAINDHGPITPDKINSAMKRVLGNLANVPCAHDQLRALGVREIEITGLMRPQDRALLVEARDALRDAIEARSEGVPGSCVTTLAKLDEALK